MDTPHTDDLPEQPLPMTEIAAAQHDRLQTPEVDPGTPAGQVILTVDEALYKFSNHASMVLNTMQQSWQTAIERLDHNQQAVAALATALQGYVPCVPYSATVHVTTPSGYPMSFTLQARTQDEFFTNMQDMLGFFKDNAFNPGAPF